MNLVKLSLSPEWHRKASEIKEGMLLRAIYQEFNKDTQEWELLLEDVGTMYTNVNLDREIRIT